jgi:hypothetical protein
MKINNFWIIKSKEKIILKMLDWCHKNDKIVEKMDYSSLLEALKSPIRNTSGI